MRIDPNDFEPLEQRHRDVMLDLILVWGALDGALGILLSSKRGMPLDVGAREFSTVRSSAKLQIVCEALGNVPGGGGIPRTKRSG